MQIGELTALALLTSAAGAAVTPRYRMHLDADRDGVVDDNWRNLDAWHWGPGGRGAIVLCNNDSDDSTPAADNADARVNGGNDGDEVAPIVFRRRGPAAPGSWAGFLEVSADDARRLRVFDRRAAGGAEIIGPTAGARFRFPDLAFTEREFGMEALRYAGAGFPDGLVRLTFTIEDGGSVLHRQHASVRVAPWMMPNHLDPAERVFVVDAGADNARFRTDLAAVVGAAGCAFEQFASPDIWMQDCTEIGVAVRPAPGGPLLVPAAVRAQRDRELKDFPRTLLAPDVGYEEVTPIDPTAQSTFDSTGNLEVTPPITAGTRRRYPWGRIYYGPGRRREGFNSDTAAFLRAQHVQAPFEVDTDWLAVGHVDEVISFIPSPGGRGFKLLLASPRRAYAILRRARPANGSARLLTNRFFPPHAAHPGGPRRAEVSIQEFLATGIPALGFDAAALRAFNLGLVAGKMDQIRQVFRREIGATNAEIVEVPILYMPNDDNPAFADALTGGMVNMLVVNGHCAVPKPFGPVVGGADLFEEELRPHLAAAGMTSTFIDDWYEYHVRLGEIHCGSNTLRRPNPPPPWWAFR